MNWSIPAKTFFLGEYVAMTGDPAIVLTTEPCFELRLTEQSGLQGIHPDSPAGRFWMQQGRLDKGLAWHDPYNGCGGLGASSAQWLGAYLASHYLQNQLACPDEMLNAYFKSAWQGVGIRPSGYDVVAQSMQGCVYIDRQQAHYLTYDWPFPDLAFILLHTGEKLATHQHLQTLTLGGCMEQLVGIVKSAKLAFESANSEQIIDAVNAYHECLQQQGLVATHSLHLMAMLKKNKDILAMKGCGAMGADVLLLLVPANQLKDHCEYFASSKLNILATSDNLYTRSFLL